MSGETSGETKTFEAAIANAAGATRATVIRFLELEPSLTVDGRAALVRAVGKLMPLCDQEWLRMLRDTYDDE